jgi:hypothetical protein
MIALQIGVGIWLGFMFLIGTYVAGVAILDRVAGRHTLKL